MIRLVTYVDKVTHGNLVKEAEKRGSTISRVVADTLFVKYGKKPGRPKGAKNKQKKVPAKK